MALREYRAKRNFSRTPEPKAKKASRSGHRFVIQKHDASRLHYDFRLEMHGALASWAVPKGPSLDPAEKRLAVQVEDHPLEYRKFEGVIPEGEYGGGTVMVWDQGTWIADEDAEEAYRAGKLKFTLNGTKLHGGWMLVRLKGRSVDRGRTNWLLIKERDQFARPHSISDVLTEFPNSAISGRNLDEIAEGRRSKRPKKSPPSLRKKRPTKASRHGARARSRRGAKRPARSIASRTAKRNVQSTHSLAKLAGARRGPFPKQIDPQLATLVKEPPTGDNWFHEQKFDGYRMLCRVEHGRAKFASRNHQDWTARLQSLVPTIRELPLRQAVLDGEVVVLDSHGISSFQALQNSFGQRRGGHLLYFVFDLIYFDGYDLTGVALEERKAILKRLIGALPSSAHVRFSEHMRGPGPKLHKKMCSLGLEGMISKRRDFPYVGGRSLGWLKSKCRQEQEFVIAGFTPPAGSRVGFGSLLLGYYGANGKFAYAGRVGTGFNAKLLNDLFARLRKIEQKKPPFSEISHRSWLHAVHWVQPKLVAQVGFSNWTDEGLVRQAAFLGLREDKPPREVKRESPINSPPRSK